MDVASLCAEMVRIPSENPPGGTEEVIRYIKGFTDSLGLKTRMVRSRGGRYNLVSSRPRGRLLLCGHVDVVPALRDGWSCDPLSGRISGGCVWGRGATDMKGGVAALLWACKSLADRGEEVPADLAFVCDEETSGTHGIRCLLSRKLLRPGDCLIAEPTPALCPNVGQKGLLRICFEFSGRPGHGSLYPLRGTSAIMEAYALLDRLAEIHGDVYDPGGELREIVQESAGVLEREMDMPDAGSVLQRVMYNPGRIEGGEKANIVAQTCTLELDIRVPWGCDIAGLVRDLEGHAPRAKARLLSMSEPSFTSPQSRVVRRTLEAIAAECGAAPTPVVQWAASDARYLRQAGFDVIEYGPGDITLLHAVDERVPVRDLERASRVYRRVMERYAGDDGE